jgi:hypothetical protein
MAGSQVVGFLFFFTATQLERVHGNQGSSVNKRRASRNQRARVKRPTPFETITTKVPMDLWVIQRIPPDAGV